MDDWKKLLIIIAAAGAIWLVGWAVITHLVTSKMLLAIFTIAIVAGAGWLGYKNSGVKSGIKKEGFFSRIKKSFNSLLGKGKTLDKTKVIEKTLDNSINSVNILREKSTKFDNENPPKKEDVLNAVMLPSKVAKKESAINRANLGLVRTRNKEKGKDIKSATI